MSIIYSRTQDGTLNVLCAGKVTREPEIKSTAKGDKVRFSIAYGSKQYMDCEAWADSDVGAVAGCLEKGDVIAVMGTHKAWEYNGKQYQSLSADILFTMTAPVAPPMTQQEYSAPQAPARSYEEALDSSDGELPF